MWKVAEVTVTFVEFEFHLGLNVAPPFTLIPGTRALVLNNVAFTVKVIHIRGIFKFSSAITIVPAEEAGLKAYQELGTRG